MSRNFPSGPLGVTHEACQPGPHPWAGLGSDRWLEQGFSRGAAGPCPGHALAGQRERTSEKDSLSQEGKEQRSQEHFPSRAEVLECSPRAPCLVPEGPGTLRTVIPGTPPRHPHLTPTGRVQSICFCRSWCFIGTLSLQNL